MTTIQKLNAKSDRLPLTKLLQLPMTKIDLYNVAYKCLQNGYYDHKDFVRFCMRNELPIF